MSDRRLFTKGNPNLVSVKGIYCISCGKFVVELFRGKWSFLDKIKYVYLMRPRSIASVVLTSPVNPPEPLPLKEQEAVYKRLEAIEAEEEREERKKQKRIESIS